MSVIWITGLSGAGKSTLAAATVRLLRARDRACILLDGDALREVSAARAYDRASRLAVASQTARLAALVAEQGVVAVVATLSLFHEVHAWNRQHACDYFEVFVDCPLPLLRERSRLYSDPAASDVVGVHIKAEFPLHPHLTVRNVGAPDDIERHAATLVDAWCSHVGR